MLAPAAAAAAALTAAALALWLCAAAAAAPPSLADARLLLRPPPPPPAETPDTPAAAERSGPRCVDALRVFSAALDNGTGWAEQMLDANGLRGAGFLWGNHFWLGSQTQCLQQGPRARYSVATLRPSNGSAPAAPAAPARPLLLGLCAPAACAPADLAALLRAALAPDGLSLLAVRHKPDPGFSLWQLPALYCLIVLVAAALLLVAAGTGLDTAVRSRARRRQGSYSACCAPPPGSASTLVAAEGPAANPRPYCEVSPAPSAAGSEAGADPHEHLGLAGRLLLCFSARSNLRKICDTRTEDSLACLHGLRVFSLVWVIAGHTCMFAFPFSDNKNFRQLVEKDFLFQSIGNGAFSVDTFFFISGLLVSHVFFKVKAKEDARRDGEQKQQKAQGGLVDSCVQFAGVFTYRVCRLVPPYLLVMLLAYVISQWFSHHSVFNSPVRDDINCPRYWWRNLLFVNTLFPVDDMCMIWSWYLANDTQFYALGVALLLLSVRFPKTAVTILTLLVVSSWVTTAVIVISTDHTPSIDQPLGLFDALYDKPWMRLGSYAVGLAAGLLLHRAGNKLRLHKAVVVSAWTLAMALSFSLVHGLYGSLGPVASAAYVALSHTAWCLVVAWVAIACCTGHGGPVGALLAHPALYPLSRITYCAYLTHPLIMLAVFMFMDAPVHLSRGTMSVMIFGFIVASYLLSMVVSLAFEAPVIALLNLLHPIRRKMQ